MSHTTSIFSIIPISLLMLIIGCGGGSGGGSGSNSGGDITLGNCEYTWPDKLRGTHFSFDIIDGGNTGLSSNYSVQVWFTGLNENGKLQSKNTKVNTIYDITDFSYTTSGKTATLDMTYNGGHEKYVLTPDSPRSGTYKYTAEQYDNNYYASGSYDLPASVLSNCGTLDTRIDGVTAFTNNLDKEAILNGRTADQWLVEEQNQPASKYMFTQNNDTTLVIGQVDDSGNTSNEVSFTIPSGTVDTYSGSLPSNYLVSKAQWNTFSSIYTDYTEDDESSNITTPEQLGLTQGSLQAIPQGGWLLSPAPFSRSIVYSSSPNLPLTVESDNTVIQRSRTSGTYNLFALSSGQYASLVQENESSIRLQLYNSNMEPNTNCSSGYYTGNQQTAFPILSRVGSFWYSNLKKLYDNPMTEGEDGSIYAAYTNNGSQLIIKKWNTNCEIQWTKTVSVDVQYVISVFTSIFKVEGDYVYLAYIDSLPSSSDNGLSRYTFLRAHESNGETEIIQQYERYTRYDFADTYDIAEDNNGDLFLAHGETLEKIDGETFESLSSFKVEGTHPITPLHFDEGGNLQVNYRYIITPSALSKF